MKNPFRGMDFASSEFWFGIMLGALLGMMAFALMWGAP